MINYSEFPQPAQPPRLSDAEVVGNMAAEALKDRRYNLGRTLAAIAHQAAMHDQRQEQAHQRAINGRTVHVPFAGQARTEQPVRDAYTPIPTRHAPLTVIPGTGPTGHGDRDLEDAAIGVQLEQTAVMGRPDLSPSPTLAPDSARCVARVTRDGVADECHGVAYWAIGYVGDAETPAQTAGWRHVDSKMDEHHTPEVNA